MFKDDMYTFMQKTPENNKGIRNKEGVGKTVLKSNSEKEQRILLHYLQSDFARLCLSLLKMSQNTMRGETCSCPLDGLHQVLDG